MSNYFFALVRMPLDYIYNRYYLLHKQLM